MVDLDELLRIVGVIILVDVLGLKFIWPDILPERGSQSTETAPP
jgi:ABC-type phosphate transport system auxiliary subunit